MYFESKSFKIIFNMQKFHLLHFLFSTGVFSDYKCVLVCVLHDKVELFSNHYLLHNREQRSLQPQEKVVIVESSSACSKKAHQRIGADESCHAILSQLPHNNPPNIAESYMYTNNYNQKQS